MGKRALFQKMFSPLAESPPSAAALDVLDDLTLAAGDFRVVRDRFALQGRTRHEELVEALAKEGRVRSQQAVGRAAGFVVC